MSGTGNRGVFSGGYIEATAGSSRGSAKSATDDGAAAAKNISAEFPHAEASADAAESRTAEAMNKEIPVSTGMSASTGTETAGKEKKQKKVKKRDKKEEAQTLDTSALLRKKNQRQQQ